MVMCPAVPRDDQVCQVLVWRMASWPAGTVILVAWNLDYPVTMRLAHTMLRVRNLDETLSFYTGFLGLREVRRRSIGDEATLVFVTDDQGHYHIEFTYNHDGRDYEAGDKFGHLAFHVEDLEAVVAEVERREWDYRRSKPHASSSYIFIKDPDGYDVEILQGKPHE